MKIKKPVFVVIEGIDGVGKTTCAKSIADKMNAFLYKTPSGIFEKTRKEIEKLKDNQVRLAFYLASVIYASNKINKLVPHQVVICDRYIYSTIAYHKALGVDLSYINFKKLPILFPDFCFYLYATEKERRQRMAHREQSIASASDAALEENEILQQKIHQEFIKLPIIPVNTSKLSVDEVCEKIICKITRGA